MRAVRGSVLVAALLVLLAPCVNAASSLERRYAQVDSAVVVLRTVGRDVRASEGAVREVAAAGLGSGVLVDDAGHVVTAAHVVQTADQVEAHFSDGTVVGARVVASSPDHDLALLELERVPTGARPVKLADSDDVAIGEQVFVVGAPYGIAHSMSVGYISGRHQVGEDGAAVGPFRAEVFQTDAAINQGNSGGPMFNLDGEVVGIVSYILTRSGGFDGIGFVVTSNTAQEVLFENPMFWSGLGGVFVSGPLADALNLGYQSGFLVQKVAKGSISEKLGLRPGRLPVTIAKRTINLGGDVIVSVNGTRLTPETISDVRASMARMAPGDRVALRVLRAGNFVDLTATLD